jgi:hypothetical protein
MENREIVSGKELKQKIKGQPMRPEEWEIIKNEGQVCILFEGRRGFTNCIKEMAGILPFSAESGSMNYIMLKDNNNIDIFLRMAKKHYGSPSVFFPGDGYGTGSTYLLKHEDPNLWYVNNIIPNDPE